MYELLFYEPSNNESLSHERLRSVCDSIPGMHFEHDPSAEYQPGRWYDSETCASASVDIGLPELDESGLFDEKPYEGWQRVSLRVQIPSTGPHWYVVEVLRMIEELLFQLPECGILDTEDIGPDGEGTEPGPLDRMRHLANWEQLFLAHQEERDVICLMDRPSSLALWRYRKQRKEGVEKHPDLLWPDALVLLDDDRARSCIFWEDPDQITVVPPVDLLIVRRGDTTGLLPVDELLTAASTVKNLTCGGAVAIHPDEATRQLHAQAKLLPTERYQALSDLEWAD